MVSHTSNDTKLTHQNYLLYFNDRHDSLLRTTLEGKKGCGRPRTMFLDWLLKMEISYDELKMLAQDRSRWCQ